MELVEWIKEQIFLKNLLPGQKIYSENELKELFGVSRQTVRHAIEVLEREDIVRSVKGSGTYINDSRFSVDRKHSKVMLITICEDVKRRPGISRPVKESTMITESSLTLPHLWHLHHAIPASHIIHLQ